MQKEPLYITYPDDDEYSKVFKQLFEFIISKVELYFHEKDNCRYFICNKKLYGLKSVVYSEVLSSKTIVFWKDECNFRITNENLLLKDPTTSFIMLQTPEEIRFLYNMLVKEFDCKNNKM